MSTVHTHAPSLPALLQIEQLQVHYGSVQALAGISLTVQRGELVTLLGSNGAGKSTTLRAISRLVNATAGRILWHGADLAAVPAHRTLKRGIGHCPEGRRLLNRQSVAFNLELGAYLRRDREGIAADLERCYGLFPRLAERRQQQAGALSGGEQQMLAIARALMGQPELLMLDEPSLGLAPKLVTDVMTILAELHRSGLTILLVEQNAQAALEIADRGYVLEAGRLHLNGQASDLLRNPQLKAAYLGG
ncbi:MULTISPECIES: ABC transporter ATP-binding protein [unclassified Synechococcus]|jgi:branched-chain amino acid transport system ATP-binding protein|uniref:ABC transporter ATP-binding protein n=1 Tax=unclassified Synechococcus TaxID=2626047 RepID=UPI001BDD5211|nr:MULTISPECIES: ABC transporter ATP-binding protein [unclassified Synechococcus]QVV67766.1 ABC transporter ATP-binding protein [Synechococcus sp. LA31]CAK6693288.1 High-affinity branched-chain amino acid transport ATP-binding protein LivF [Synechococcus sp. CBW1107]